MLDVGLPASADPDLQWQLGRHVAPRWRPTVEEAPGAALEEEDVEKVVAKGCHVVARCAKQTS